MNWFNGNIAEAVAQSKLKNAIFVVFVEGKDESTQKLAKFINEEKILMKLQSEDFVAIKIKSESQAYMQFASIYQMVPVPSIFFIGKSGAPLEIGTGVIASVEELHQKIEKVLAASGRSTTSMSASASFILSEQQRAGTSAAATKSVADEPLAETEVVCEGGVCYKKPKESSRSDANVEKEVVEKAEIDEKEQEKEKESSPNTENNARLEETRKLLEQKRRDRVEQESQLEKERELRRRREGKDAINLQQWQKEQELKELKENIRRDRLAEQEARDRVRAQIAGDRAERAKKTAVEVGAANANVASTNNATASTPQPNNTDTARLQFRLSSGITKTHTFNCQETLSVVRAYVKVELLPGTGIKDFILATTYPKREFPPEHDGETLVELGLFPSAVILVIGKESSSPAAIIARSGGIVNILSTLFWTMLSPVFAVFGYLKNFGSRRGSGSTDVGAQKRNNEERGVQHDAAKRRNLDRFMSAPSAPSTSRDAADTHEVVADHGGEQQKPYRRYGSSNIHRLSDNRKDSDDENATWNGNSTQQQ